MYCRNYKHTGLKRKYFYCLLHLCYSSGYLPMVQNNSGYLVMNQNSHIFKENCLHSEHMYSSPTSVYLGQNCLLRQQLFLISRLIPFFSGIWSMTEFV